MNGLDHAYYEVVRWQRVTFPVRDPLALTKHLLREASELHAEIESEVRDGVAWNLYANAELADCAILLFGIADALGIDLALVVNRKMEVNRARRWKDPDEHGVIEHERD